MSDRTDFEEWYSQERPDTVNPFERVVSDERYASMETEWAYRGYKVDAAEADALMADMADAAQNMLDVMDGKGGTKPNASELLRSALKHYKEYLK